MLLGPNVYPVAIALVVALRWWSPRAWFTWFVDPAADDDHPASGPFVTAIVVGLAGAKLFGMYGVQSALYTWLGALAWEAARRFPRVPRAPDAPPRHSARRLAASAAGCAVVAGWFGLWGAWW